MGWEIITSSVCGHVNAHLVLPNHLSAVQLVLNGIVIMYVPHFNGLEITTGWLHAVIVSQLCIGFVLCPNAMFGQ